MSGGSGSWIASGGRDRFKALEGVKAWRRGRELVEEEAMPPSDDIVLICFCDRVLFVVSSGLVMIGGKG